MTVRSAVSAATSSFSRIAGSAAARVCQALVLSSAVMLAGVGTVQAATSQNVATVSQTFQRITGSIQNSFYRSARSAGMKSATSQQFVKIFQSQIDFSRDLRAGDRFEVLVSGGGEMIAARLYQKKNTRTALLYTDGQYYSENGQLVSGRTFDRCPLGTGFKVSSGFNPGRKHPVLGKVRPHNGTDWSAPVGTEIHATADGVVVKAGKNHPSMGNYIEIRNGKHYSTRFLHMSELDVKVGDRVSRGEVIGLSGNTGLSTGPHLHYELHINGKAVDALKARLTVADTLKGKALSQFRKDTAKVLAALGQKSSQVMLANHVTAASLDNS